MLQLQLQAEFEDFQSENPQSKKIKVKRLKTFPPHSKKYLDKIHVSVCFDQYSKEFEDANEAMNHFKSLYPEWYIPFFNYILRATKNVAKELKTPIRSMYRDDFNNESKLNNLLDIPKNIQEGPETETFVDLPWDLFCQIVFSTFKELGKIDVALVVLDKYVGSPVKSISSKSSGATAPVAPVLTRALMDQHSLV